MKSTKKKYPAETDLKKVKTLGLVFLELDIQTTKISPLVVKHPFTDSGIAGIRTKDGNIDLVDLINDPNALQTWRTQIRQLISKAEKPLDILMMVTKSYKLAFLKHAVSYLSEQDMASLLAQAWIIAEAPNSDPNISKRELVALFRSVDPKKLMDEKEYELFCGLDDVITIYRGVTSYNAKDVKVLSWTLNRATAEWFATRFNEQGTVYEAQIDKQHICAVFLGRNEAEVIVDPKYLQGITPIQSQQEELQMKGLGL